MVGVALGVGAGDGVAVVGGGLGDGLRDGPGAVLEAAVLGAGVGLAEGAGTVEGSGAGGAAAVLTATGSTGAGWRVTVARAEGDAAGTDLLTVADWLSACIRKITTAATAHTTTEIAASQTG